MRKMPIPYLLAMLLAGAGLAGDPEPTLAGQGVPGGVIREVARDVTLEAATGVAEGVASASALTEAPRPPRKPVAKPAKKAAADKPEKPAPIQPMAMPFDPKLIVFPYDPNYTYPILTRPGIFTHIQLAEGEVVTGWYLSDTLRWSSKVAASKRDIFIKPILAEEMETVGTILTNRRRYQLQFQTTENKARFYQRVSWEVSDDAFEDEEALSAPAPRSPRGARGQGGGLPGSLSFDDEASPSGLPLPTAAGASSVMTVNLERLNFAYEISGEAPFKPTMVLDDGRFTWIALPKVQDIPAIFALDAHGAGEMVVPVVRGDYYVISRLLPYGALLKLGSAEVRIRARNARCGGVFQPACNPIQNIKG